MKKITILILAVVLTALSCKKETSSPPTPSFYDDYVPPGHYLCRDRANTEMSVTRPDSLKISLNIGKIGGVEGYILRKYPKAVGYEVDRLPQVIRFKKEEKGFTIVGDTFSGYYFEFLY